MKFTLFEALRTESPADIAAALGVSRSTLYRVMWGDIGVSTRMHERCRKLWAAAYDLEGTASESFLRVQARRDGVTA